jgi:gamma-glutamyltranspeptidase/glutathione hydrolase/leukotriene-C4 hydrolase
MAHNKDWRDIFAPNGHVLREGEFIHQTNLSRALDAIAREGAGGFYQVSFLTYSFASF